MTNISVTKCSIPPIGRDCPRENITQLARSVILQALKDLQNKADPIRALDSLVFFVGDGFKYWSTLWMGEDVEPWFMLCHAKNGRVRQRSSAPVGRSKL